MTQERTAARTAVDSKPCRRCQEVKGAEEFYKSKQTADGLQSYCKACCAQTSQGRRSKESKEQREHQALTSPCASQSPDPCSSCPIGLHQGSSSSTIVLVVHGSSSTPR